MLIESDNIHTCTKCGFVGLIDKFRTNTRCKKCENERVLLHRKSHPEHYREYQINWKLKNIDHVRELDREASKKRRYQNGGQSMSENIDCPLFLGVHVAERVLSHIFNDVERMPLHNQGFDFICNKGKKIDVKSCCIHHRINRRPSWSFHIRENKTADYFLCLAFDNRTDLNPQHIWLLPGDGFNHLTASYITTTTLAKWDEYALDINKIKSCCDVMRD